MGQEDEEEYVPNEFTRYIPIDMWRKLNMGIETESLLQERQKTHGSFELNASISQDIKYLFAKQKCYEPLIDVHKESLDMIALKISRILSGQANFKDHWDDIAGYAKLGSEACE